MKIRGFITHKAAELYSDCADYFRICPQSKRVAVSDGVSQSILPAEWARILVDSYVEREWCPGEDIKPLREKWARQAYEYLEEQKRQGMNPWILENCLLNQEGAAATFCGIEFTDDGKWHSAILGDSSLVIIDDSFRIVNIYSSNEGTFDYRPDYFDSIKNDKGESRDLTGELSEGFKIFLVSDPFSELFQKVKGKPEEVIIINELLSLPNNEGFCSLVDKLRKDFQMHNDDSTLVIIEPDDSIYFNVLYEKTLDSSIEDEREQIKKEKEELERRRNMDEKLWHDAAEKDDEAAYKYYLENSIDGFYRKEAEEKLKLILDEIAEREAWESAVTTDTIMIYDVFLEKNPKSIHAIEAKNRITELKSRLSPAKKPEAKEESQEEKSTEDPVCQESEQAIEKKSVENDTDVHSKEDDAKSLRQEQEKKDSDSVDQGAISRDTENNNSESNGQQRGFHPKQVEIRQLTETTQIDLPEDVDPSDGIDRVEFVKLQETALLLFSKYHSRFETAFSRQKWNTDRSQKINDCFKLFWSELETIIFKQKRNG